MMIKCQDLTDKFLDGRNNEDVILETRKKMTSEAAINIEDQAY